MKRQALFLIIFVFIFIGLAGAQEITLTLDEALVLALRDNREVLLKAADVSKAKEKIAESKGPLFPSLSFTGSRALTRGYYSKDTAQTTTQTTLKQYLYKGGETINTIQENKYKLAVSQALLDKTKLEIALKVEKSFYTLLLAGAYAELNKKILKNSQAHLSLAQARYQNGEASESDILKIKESLSSVEEAYSASLNQLTAASALLNNLLYLEQDTEIKAQGEFVYLPEEVAYDQAFLKAMEKRPEIRQYQAQIQADKKAIEVAKADNRPSIYASWDYYSRSHVTATTGKNWNDYNVVGLTFSWPIFDGWATKAKVEQAIINLKQAQLNQEKNIRDIALELKDAYLDLQDAIAGLKSKDAQITLYRDNLSVAQQKYTAGIASTLDLDDAGLKSSIAEFDKQESIYAYILTKAAFDQATGGTR